MKKYLSIIFIISISLQSCHVGTTGTWKNGNIPPAVRSDIAALNKSLINNMYKKDVEAVKKLMSDLLLEKSEKRLDSMINIFGPEINPDDYTVIDEYYTKNTATNIPNTLISANGDNRDYFINYLALNKEMYASVLKSTKSNTGKLILAIYGKYGDSWKINILQLGQYDVLNKSAPDYYIDAVKLYKAGDLIDAADMIIMASQLGTPAGPYFKYKNEGEMKNFYSKVVTEANTTYKFPITINGIKSKPIIFGVNSQFIAEPAKEGIYPSINYKSEIKINDTTALKAENNAIQKVIGGVFKEIDKHNNHILYQAFDRIPDGKSEFHRYGFVQKIK